MSEHELVFDRYGKAQTRVVHVDRRTPRHAVRDLNVTTALRGDFAAAYTRGDNTGVMATDSQRNAVNATARETGVGEGEEFAVALGRRLLDAAPAADRAEVTVDEHPWSRVGDHDHAFTRAGGPVRTARAELGRNGGVLTGGVRDLVVMKTTGSEYSGFQRERYTTLPETTDRVLATSVTATWTYSGDAVDAATGGGWAPRWWAPSPTCTPWPCSRPCTRWPPPSSTRTRRWRPWPWCCPTATTSSSTSPPSAWTTPGSSSTPTTAPTGSSRAP